MLRKQLPYIVGFVLLAFFCCYEFGPVLRHLAEENYVSLERLPMAYVLRRSLGMLFWVGRFLMLPLQSQWLGGLYVALLLTLSAWLADKSLCLRQQWRGLGFVLPVLVMGWAAYRGYNLYMRNEPSQLILWIWGLLLLTSIGAGISALLLRSADRKTDCKTNCKTDCKTDCKAGSKEASQMSVRPYGLVVGLVALVTLCGGTYAGRQNLLLSCEMQNLLIDEDWEAMNEAALSARRPDRSVAAFNVIALNQMGQVLERAFELDYDYPTVQLDSIGGMDEGVNYIAECNLHAGLVQPAYHYAMEQLVMSGPRLRYFKLMALTALINNERALCEKMLHVISQMPLQSGYVEHMRELLNDESQRDSEPMIARIRQFLPQEDKFEQNFRTPAFLGYNVGVLAGTDETLNTSVAAALYSKDMENIILRASYLQQKRTLPLCVQQALVIASFKRPGLLDRFPGIDKFVQNEVQNFAIEAAPLSKDKSEEGKELMRKTLVDNWKGTYMYYYYCGNLNQTVQRKTETAVN
ncbi:MAG: DUF6057 family protein [Bacteroidaceae bacterium]|nr:DUF6057 family protein [Bacteroidaceae bacterium]